MGTETAANNEGLVAGKTVELEKDVSETDQYGRLLRYVWIGDSMVNAELVRPGYATAHTYEPDVKCQDLFVKLQRDAREARLGLWAPMPVPEPTLTPSAGLVQLVVNAGCSQFDAPGNDSDNNEAEWVCFANVGGQRPT